MRQKDIFLESEGNAWYKRNIQSLKEKHFPDSDPLLKEILAIPDIREVGAIIEIGCGDGGRLAWLHEQLGLDVYGIDPSQEAVDSAQKQGVNAQVGTADLLPFEDNTFDIVIFGFCLYLCDRQDLFRIAKEADRVLKNRGWVLIMDFYSENPSKNEYHHFNGLFSFKMDYRSMFTWNPAYTCYSHKITHHSEQTYTDDLSEWVATSVLRKNMGYYD